MAETKAGTEAGTGMGTGAAGAGADWRAWQESWDLQQEWYMPDREERFRVMLGGGPPMP